MRLVKEQTAVEGGGSDSVATPRNILVYNNIKIVNSGLKRAIRKHLSPVRAVLYLNPVISMAIADIICALILFPLLQRNRCFAASFLS